MPEIFKRTEAVASGEFVVVTTDAIEGHPVREYLAIVAGEMVVEVPALRAQNDSQRRPPSATLLQRRLSEGRSRAISTWTRSGIPNSRNRTRTCFRHSPITLRTTGLGSPLRSIWPSAVWS